MLDTHVLIWWVNDHGDLSAAALKTIKREQAQGQILISSITAWEIALLVKKGRLALTMDLDDWLSAVVDIENVSFVPVDNEIAVQSIRLPGTFHSDPADRIITAMARHYSASLVTCDARIREYKHLSTIW